MFRNVVRYQLHLILAILLSLVDFIYYNAPQAAVNCPSKPITVFIPMKYIKEIKESLYILYRNDCYLCYVCLSLDGFRVFKYFLSIDILHNASDLVMQLHKELKLCRNIPNE